MRLAHEWRPDHGAGSATGDSSDRGAATPLANNVLVATAACLPLAALLVTCMSAALLFGDAAEPIELLQMGGAFSYLTLGIAAVAAQILVVSLFMVGRGARIPSALVLFVASWPWLCGVAAYRVGVHRVLDAVAFVAGEHQLALLSVGMAEASVLPSLGGLLGSGLLGATGLALAIAAYGQRAPDRRAAAAIVGLVPGLALLALPLLLLVLRDGSPALLVALLPATAAAVGLPLAAAAMGNDAPHGRSAALGAAAAWGFLLAFLALAAAFETVATVQTGRAVTAMEPELNGPMLATVTNDTLNATVFAVVGAGTLLITAIATAAWSAYQVRPALGRAAGAAFVVIVTVIVAATDAGARYSTDERLRQLTELPWNDLDDFRPAHLRYGDLSDHCALTVGVTQVAEVHGGAIVPTASLATEAGRATLARVLVDAPAPEEGDPSLPFVDDLDDGPPGQHGPSDRGPTGKALRVAIDRRVRGDAIVALIDGARDSGRGRLELVGQDERHAASQGAGRSPAFAAFVRRPHFVTAYVPDAALVARAEADPWLWHGVAGTEGDLSLATRPGGHADTVVLDAMMEPFRLGAGVDRPDRGLWPPFEDGDADREEGPIVYLQIDRRIDGGRLTEVVAWIERAGGRAMLITGDIPGRPNEPVISPTGGILAVLRDVGGAGDGGTGGLFGEGGLGAEGIFDDLIADNPQGTIGLRRAAAVDGERDAASIRQVLQAHRAEMRHCYEQELVRSPTLEGRFVVRLIITPGGTVQHATIADGDRIHPGVEACVLARLRRLRFPRGSATTTINYPLIFRTAP